MVHTQFVREGKWLYQCHATRFSVCALSSVVLSVKERLHHESLTRTISRRRDNTQVPCRTTSYSPAVAQGALSDGRARTGRTPTVNVNDTRPKANPSIHDPTTRPFNNHVLRLSSRTGARRGYIEVQPVPYLAATGGSADDDCDSDVDGDDEDEDDRAAKRRARWVRTQTWARRLTTQTLLAEGQEEAVRGVALMTPGCLCRVQLEVARAPDADNLAAALRLVDGALRTAALTWADLSVRAGPD